MTKMLMSLAQNPVMGKMAKSFANVNTYVHKGQNVISAKAFNRKDKNTEAQQSHRTGFKLISDVWASLGGYGESGFPARPERLSAFNVFMSLNLPKAIDSSGDVPVVDYSLLQIAKGSLPGVDNVTASITAQGITLEGETLADFPKALATDVITVLVKKVNGTVKAVRQARGTGADFTILFALPGIAAADMEYVYVFTNSADGKKVSNSVYVAVV
jgi:hypothetical protein